jgi:hypothetical protein
LRVANPTQVAECIIEVAKASKKSVLASWTGGARVHPKGIQMTDKEHKKSTNPEGRFSW